MLAIGRYACAWRCGYAITRLPAKCACRRRCSNPLIRRHFHRRGLQSPHQHLLQFHRLTFWSHDSIPFIYSLPSSQGPTGPLLLRKEPNWTKRKTTPLLWKRWGNTHSSPFFTRRCWCFGCQQRKLYVFRTTPPPLCVMTRGNRLRSVNQRPRVKGLRNSIPVVMRLEVSGRSTGRRAAPWQ